MVSETDFCLVRNTAESHQAFPVVDELHAQVAIDVIVCVAAHIAKYWIRFSSS